MSQGGTRPLAKPRGTMGARVVVIAMWLSVGCLLLETLGITKPHGALGARVAVIAMWLSVGCLLLETLGITKPC